MKTLQGYSAPGSFDDASGWQLPNWLGVARSSARNVVWAAGLKFVVLDFSIGLLRKIGGFCALLALGWLFVRLVVLKETPQQVYPGAPDPDLRQTLYIAMYLVLAQGWDIPTDQLVRHWLCLKAYLPIRPAGEIDRPRRQRPRVMSVLEPALGRLAHFMDFCVAASNKLGALAALGSLGYFAEQFGVAGISMREMYPKAIDPTVSLLADLGVDFLVLGWWATSFAQIKEFWRRFRCHGHHADIVRDERIAVYP